MSKIEKILQYRKSLIESYKCLILQMPNFGDVNFDNTLNVINSYFNKIDDSIFVTICVCNNAMRTELGLPNIDYKKIPNYWEKLCASSDKGVKEKLSYYLQVREKIKDDSDYLELINKDIEVLLCI